MEGWRWDGGVDTAGRLAISHMTQALFSVVYNFRLTKRVELM